MKSCNLLFAALFAGPIAWSQTTTVTLEQCYRQARENYPLIKQKELLVKSKEYTIANAHSGYLPQLAIYGQATYQSDVTRVPVDIPGVTPPARDQYKIYGEVTQAIYDGGNIKRQGALQEINSQVEDQRTEVELYRVKERINQLYFGILLSDDQLTQTMLLKKDVQSSLTKTESAIRNGIAFKSNADLLKAELLRTDQRIVELKATRKAYLTMLAYFIHQQLADNVTLERPALIVASSMFDIKRPELQLYQHQATLLTVQNKLGNTRNMPRIGLFFQGGYGRPALNVLKNDFAAYYIGGVRLNWSLGGLYNSKRDKQLLDVATQQVNLQKDLFLFNTNLSLAQQQQEIARLQELISIDNQIIELRTRIKNTSHAQHENGVITTNDYLRDLNAEDQSKQNLLLHNTQLLLAQYNYQTTSGN
jgi:outer membrane protein TolC